MSDATAPRIALLGVPIEIGASQLGTLMGPDALRTAGIGGPPNVRNNRQILMVRRRASAVSNHVARLVPFILRDAAARLLRMRSTT